MVGFQKGQTEKHGGGAGGGARLKEHVAAGGGAGGGCVLQIRGVLKAAA